MTDKTMPSVPTQAKETTVLVLGGAGFIGRHAVAALCQRRCRVVVASRHPLAIDARLPAGAVRCPRRTARFEALLEPTDWTDLLAGIDVVVNCVGILRQRGRETYARIHHLAPAALANACAARGIRLVHVSALGLRAEAGSRFLRSKLAGEEAIRAAGGDWRIVRPSLLDGREGYGARWLRALARLPLHATPADATGCIAALHVDDLGEALARLALMPDAPGEGAREFELGGAQAFALADHLARLRGAGRAPAWRIALPSWLARGLSHACDVLHFSPFSYGHWELLRHDNVPQHNRLPELLGREPRPLGDALPPTRIRAPGVLAPPAATPERPLAPVPALTRR
jgi:uncharacterized protein YbjT (DUF2867 family)